MVELTLRRCGADVAQLRAYDRLNASAKHHWGCTSNPAAIALQLVVHVGPEPGGGGPCAWPEAARWLRSAPNVVAISRTMFEVDGMPAEATARCNEYDEVWVPASFNLDTFSRSGVSLQRLRTLGEGYDAEIFFAKDDELEAAAEPPTSLRGGGAVDWGALALAVGEVEPEPEPEKAGEPEEAGAEGGLPAALSRFIDGGAETVRKPFVFLSVFKWEARKGWKYLLAAFWAEFIPQTSGANGANGGRGRGRGAVLVIKTSMPLPPDRDLLHHSDRPVHQIAAWAWELGHDVSTAMGMVHVHDGMLSAATLGELYRGVDGFVLATHGEGWGLPLLEAMASGLPTIATAWGGQTDFMQEERAFLVAPEAALVPAPDDFEGFAWAQPDQSSLRAAMRRVVEGCEGGETQAVARRGLEWVREHYQYRTVAAGALRLLADAAELPAG